MNIPPQLQYNQLQTRGFFSVFKQWPIQPIANSGQYWPGQIIRIFLNSLTDGVMDPYRTHMQITVQCDQQTLPVGLLQVDNSAQSFIQQLVISSRNRQVQRIIQYGVLAAYLTDIGLSQLYAQGRQTQGLGYSNIDNYSHVFQTSNSVNETTYINFQKTQQVIGDKISLFGNNLCNPTIPNRFYFDSGYGYQNKSLASMSQSTRNHLNALNPALVQCQDVHWWNSYMTGSSTVNTLSQRAVNINSFGYLYNIRAQYLSNIKSNKYIQSTSCFSSNQVRLSPDVQNQSFPAKFQKGTVYNTYIPQFIRSGSIDPTGPTVQYNSIPNSTSLLGYQTLISPQFSKGVNEPFISPTVPQGQIKNGKIVNEKFAVVRRTFKFPLISSIIGVLIPQSQFVLLPLKTLMDTLIQMTIDPYAMFTSGYNDISQFDNVGMNTQQQRAFKVARVVYNLHTYQFYNSDLDQYFAMSINSGIAINTHMWQLGNQYQIQNSQSLSNSWPVACNQQALNQIVILFYPLDFQNYSFCRKHFRISNNIQQMQLRINMDYYPSQPLSGNSGNPIAVDNTGDNSVFLQQLFYSNNYMFSNLTAMPRINPYNFSLNQRIYDVTNTNTFYDPSMIDNPDYNWNVNSINSDTAMGMANIHENRCVGKAAFVYSFQPYAHSAQFLTGINCKKTKTFDVLFTSGIQNWFPRPQMMFIFTRSSNVIQYGSNGIININK